MALRMMDVSQDVGNGRAVALLHALRDPAFAEFLAPADRARLEGFGAIYHTKLTHQDAVWMGQKLAELVQVEPPRTKRVEMEDGVPPIGMRVSG